MPKNLFVGGFPYETSQDDLVRLFSSCGTVTSAKIILERETGRSKGFGFVEMSTDAEAAAALQKINGSELGGRKIFVTEARPPEPRPAAGAGGLERKPGFVERRSGKDRRQSGGASQGERRDFGEKKPWADKKPYGEKKPWGDKKPYGEKKPWGDKKPYGEKKPWGDKKPYGDKKPWGDKKPYGDRKPYGEKKAWGEKKPWEHKKPDGDAKPFDEKKKVWGDKKPWDNKKPYGDKKKGPGGGKKWGAGGPDAGERWVPKRNKFGKGLFGGKSRRSGS